LEIFAAVLQEFHINSYAVPFAPPHHHAFTCCSKSQYLEIFAAVLQEFHINSLNPLRPLMYKLLWWRPDVARGAAALAIHDSLMSDKLTAQLAQPPPDYTITGEACCILRFLLF
jgi:hypothetical protein